MFLIGVNVDHSSTTAFFVVIEKSYKNVKHYYVFKETRRVPAAACGNEISAFYNDSAYTIRKRIFSQERRPKKDVSARPTVVIAARQEDMAMIDALRRADVPVEAVFVDTQKTGSLPAPDRAGIGKNHRASVPMLHETMVLVQGQKRIMPLTDAISENSLMERLGAMPASPGDMTPLLLAAAVPIWFRENIKYTSAYRTSATSIRKYK